MKKSLIIIAIAFLIVFLSTVGLAVSSTIKDSYKQRETVIGQLSENILQTIKPEQVKLFRDNVQIAFDYDIQKLGNSHYIWLTAPQNEDEYTLVIEDIVEDSGDGPEFVDYEKRFRVENISVDYNIKPGFIFASRDFNIEARLFEDFSKAISVNFPDDREIVLDPGLNFIDFSIGDVEGTQLIMISLGRYTVPAYIMGQDKIFCGDGKIEGDEVCECGLDNICGNTDDDVANNTCASENFGSGILSCGNDCRSFDNSQCSLQETECGDGIKEGYEECDDGNNNNEDGCSSECELEEGEEVICGDGKIEGDEVCDIGEDLISGTGDDNLNDKSCNDFNSYSGGILGCKAGCLEFEFLQCRQGGARFRFDPALIRSVVLISDEIPAYPFEIFNLGEEPIDSLAFDYDREKFLIEPEEDFVIAPNESRRFELQILDDKKEFIRGAIIADLGAESEFLLFSISFTQEEGEVKTEYLRENTGAASSYYCSELSGNVCDENEICDGDSISALDGTCCIGSCETESGGSRIWIGLLIAAIVIAILAFIYFRYKRTAPKKSNN